MKPRRIQLIFFVFVLLFGVVIARLISISLLVSPEKIIQNQMEEKNTLLRGDIYSSEKDILSITLPFYSIYINPSQIKKGYVSSYTSLLTQLGVSESQIQTIMTSDKKFRWLNRMIPKETFLSLQKHSNLSLPGIGSTQEYKRVYPHRELVSSVVGFTDIDGNGLSGIELSMDNYLAPSIFSQDQGHLLGYDVVLTLNSKLQYLVEQTVHETQQELHPKSISALIVEASSGKILSMVSEPTFDPNLYNSYKDPSIFINTCVSNIDEPGSTFKPLVMAYLFDHHLITKKSHFSSMGKEIINGFTIKEAQEHKLGGLYPEDILVKSSNIGMAKASQILTKEDIYTLLTSLHFGQKSGILLPGEEKGIIRTSSEMTPRSKLSIPIGQEIGLTPLQLVNAFTTIANHGIFVSAHIIDRLEYEGKPVSQKIIDGGNNGHENVAIFSPATADLMLQYMRQVVLRGSGQKTNIPGEWIAAKTGTAQIFDTSKQSYSNLNTSLIAIYENKHTHKRYIIYGVIRSPQVDENITWGGTLAAPMVRNFIQSLISVLKDEQ